MKCDEGAGQQEAARRKPGCGGGWRGGGGGGWRGGVGEERTGAGQPRAYSHMYYSQPTLRCIYLNYNRIQKTLDIKAYKQLKPSPVMDD